jgi:transposase InsO family protein
VPRSTVTGPAAVRAPELLGRDFRLDAPYKARVTDITYLPTSHGWCYLAAIVDWPSRLVVGWAVPDHMRTDLCIEALNDARSRRRPGAGLVHHSDRGPQYTSYDYRKALTDSHLVASMSRKGNCWDNAVAESFWATVKRELINDMKWGSKEELEAALFGYIEIDYNRERVHSSLDYMTPREYDDSYQETAEAA